MPPFAHPLSSWALNVAPSPTLAIDTKAKALQAAGEDMCSFAAGEPDFDTPEHIKEAAAAALKSGKTKYAPTAGIEPLRKAIAAKYAEEYGLRVAPSQVVVSPGGKFSCYLAMLAVCSPGDEVIIPAPYWVSYPEMAKLAGAVPRFVLADDSTGFRLSAAELEAGGHARGPGSWCSTPRPIPPVRSTRGRRSRGSWKSRCATASTSSRTRSTSTCSTTGRARWRRPPWAPRRRPGRSSSRDSPRPYSMTGWRLGTLVAPAPIAKAVAELQSQMTSNATTFAQYGALAALQEKEKTRAALEAMLAAFDRRRKFLHAELVKIPGVSCLLAEGAFYLFPKIGRFGIPSLDFCARLLEREKVAAVHGSAFGAEGYMRLSYATSDAVIAKGVERLRRFCAGFEL